MAPDISVKIQEFDNNFNPSFDIETTKYLGNHWEVGAELGLTKLA